MSTQTTRERRHGGPRRRQVVRDGVIHRICPIDLAPLPPVPVSGLDDVEVAITRARVAQERWQARKLDSRVTALQRAAKRILARRDEFLSLVRDEIGKNEVEALFSEALGPLDSLNGWVRVVRGARRRHVRLNPLSFPWKSARYDLVPRGVIGVIAPWNYPMGGLFRSLWPALLTGNGVVVKPSEYSPLSSAWFVRQIAEEVPDGLVSVLQGDGWVGRALIESGVDACVFTGSPATGAEVRQQCARLGIPCSAEMGGNDAAIVLADCDLDRTAAGITHWALHNAGQACGAVELVYVEHGIADALVERLAGTWCKLRAGSAEPGDAEVSPLANRHQLDIVEQHVDDAVQRGATVVCGGAPTGEGLFYAPTVLDGCTPDMLVVQEETFGPVLAILRVESPEAAVAQINTARYGLGASIWTGHTTRARRLAKQLDVGVVAINNHSMTGAIAELPWSGTGATGYGVANSELSLLTFARPRTLLEDRASDPEPFWMPFDRDLFALGQLLSDAQIGKLAGAWRIPGLLRRRVRAVRARYSG